MAIEVLLTTGTIKRFDAATFADVEGGVLKLRCDAGGPITCRAGVPLVQVVYWEHVEDAKVKPVSMGSTHGTIR